MNRPPLSRPSLSWSSIFLSLHIFLLRLYLRSLRFTLLVIFAFIVIDMAVFIEETASY